MMFLERWFRKRAMQRDPLDEAGLPASLQAVAIGTVVPINGYNFRVMHRRCEPGGRHPALVLSVVGPTRRRLKTGRSKLKRLLRLRQGQTYVD